MASKLKSDDEVKAWDQYFAAALPLGREFSAAGSHNEFLVKVVKEAANIADLMVVERRKRDLFA